MDGDLSVEPGLLRDRAVELELVARGLAAGLGSDLCVPAPDWSSGTSLAELSGAVASSLGAAAARVAHSGGLLREAAGAYEDADVRAARRLGGVGW
ncbi:hypothetical protein [Asanoa iriomotensis]|uniref:Excreted virulence factor EspC (Type VII ESX diderm) n=1 Tax=Asanoa iriomotensis TaxID=234613 RepID=A0ABQ4BV05_9ACTN|nr:hypothetical protein [Asanoa iriomotensis]GIF54357.1 hypothetical protein Air01nite_04520 [Asanoa iriomotensis]